MNWFECKVKYNKVDEKTGNAKKVTEPYIVDAVSFTDAEAMINKELEKYISGEFIVTNINKSKYTDVFPFDTGDRWFKIRVSYIALDEESGKSKKITDQILIMAREPKEAIDNLKDSLSDETIDFEITSVTETKIVDVFPYFENEDQMADNLKPMSDYNLE